MNILLEIMKKWRAAHWKKILIFPAVGVGILVFMFLVEGSKGPQKAPLKERVYPVRVIEVPIIKLIPRALAFGTVQPGTVWEGISEVSGKIVEKHPKLAKGERLYRGDLLMRIDPTDYELSVAQNKLVLRKR